MSLIPHERRSVIPKMHPSHQAGRTQTNTARRILCEAGDPGKPLKDRYPSQKAREVKLGAELINLPGGKWFCRQMTDNKTLMDPIGEARRAVMQ